MYKIKPILTVILIFSVMTLTSGAAYADPSWFADGYVSIEFSKNTAKVNDTVRLTVTAYNTGIIGWNNVILSIPTPNGLKFLRSDTTISQNNYNSITGLWTVQNMRHDQHGKTKTLYITLTVLPEAKGKTIKAHARFTNIVLEGGQEHFENRISGASDTLKIINENSSSHPNNNTNDTGNGNKPGNGTGNGTGNGYQEIMGSIVNGTNAMNIGNAQSEKSAAQQSGGGGKNNNKKAYEITKDTPPKQTPSNLLYSLLVVLAIVALVSLGYFNRMRNS
jgi:uncharacterized repeat protein (TIGR01451 family)